MDNERSGALGCGCALLPGLLLGVVVYVLVGLVAREPSPVGADRATIAEDRVSVALSEEYLGRLVSASLAGGPLQGIEVEAMPGNELVIRGQATMTVLGRELGLPVSFRLGVTVRDGNLEFRLLSSELPGGMDATEATAMTHPLLARLAGSLQVELERALGSGWCMEEIRTEADSVVLVLVGPEAEP
ncbi:MAG: hypothetical protein HPY83_06155 [Anaerolineae bacterium]|nr:hypothetical protein [Anaerolineae bacterium]